jgi:hypothetical protein
MKLKQIIKKIIRPFNTSLDKEKQLIDSYLLDNGFKHISFNEPQDIFIVGFPKSGNTWIQNLISGILFGIDTNFLPDKLTQILTPNIHGSKYYKRLLDFTCFKSHLLPQPEYKKVVYIVRDGRDSLVSYYHMIKAQGQFTTMQEMVVDGKGLSPCKWHEHVRQWKKNKYNAEILWIRYEDLHSKPLEEMRRFCEFAGIERTDEIIQRSIKGNLFNNMQKKEEEFGWDNQKWNKEEKFIRKGKTGGYLEEMNHELIKIFDAESKTELLDLGYELFPEKK